MSLLNFIAFYLLFLLLSALIIIGFYIITRGERSIQPDGTIRFKGKIFKQWSLYWERTTGSKRIYYSGDALKEKLRWLKEYNANFRGKLEIAKNLYSVTILEDLSPVDILYIEDVLRCQVERATSPNLYLYVEEPQYHFPEWLRYPLSQCPPCMASIGGTLLYWPVVLLAGNIFDWTTGPHALPYFYFWVLFCFALSALNKLFYNIIGS